MKNYNKSTNYILNQVCKAGFSDSSDSKIIKIG